MTDDETLLLLSAYADGELSPGEVLAMERRLAADPDARALAERLRDLSATLRGPLAGPPAPESLRARVIEQIGFTDPPPSRGRLGGPLGTRLGSWVGTWVEAWLESWRRSRQALAATLLVGLVGGAALGGGIAYLDRPDGAPDTGAAVLAGHLRGLAAPQPFDVASSDRHVVKPWFNGRTPLAPEAPDLSDKGFPLVGGRVDIVGGTPVPTLVYRRDRHVISVTVVPAADGPGAGEERRDGSTIERWRLGDLTYWAVSDLNRRDLRAFADLFQSRTGGPPG
ncbi:anti-sigma factor [Methylobacterium sp. 13MFTsu3.1M2]|uniref:anti-sigma factor family protein n=1 Tax=Methylobacterium sp. 13MFTsu3.1M2 TaxID=1502776 RepID=UPI0008DF9C64|nr:anti-sigma factor [Methylobacterium sp. 13MFTsu3.1M2]SFD66816.1 Transmembrane transcriptional regulator (anti-sigma factor RsiW) [Methylobacterium sp. 13MFTsu3.1M2]